MKGEFRSESVEREGSPPSAELAGRVVRAVEEALKLPHPAPADEALCVMWKGLTPFWKKSPRCASFLLPWPEVNLTTVSGTEGLSSGR